MAVSKCLKEAFGFIGCSINVLEAMDSHCSGRRSCTVRVLSENFNNIKPCHVDLKSYLHVHYECLTISENDFSCPNTNKVAPLKTTSYLPSIITIETGCGSTHTPWCVRVEKGQKISLTLFDFTSANQIYTEHNNLAHGFSQNREFNSNENCLLYGKFRELDTDFKSDYIQICQLINARQKNIYVSTRNQIEVQLFIGQITTAFTPWFLIKFDVIGCQKLEPPPLTWIKENEDSLLIGCTTSSHTWYIQCKANEWTDLIQIINCTDLIEINVEENAQLKSSNLFSSGIIIVLASIITFVIGIIMVLTGAICYKKCRIRKLFHPRKQDQNQMIKLYTKSNDQPIKGKLNQKSLLVSYGVCHPLHNEFQTTSKIELEKHWFQSNANSILDKQNNQLNCEILPTYLYNNHNKCVTTMRKYIYHEDEFNFDIKTNESPQLKCDNESITNCLCTEEDALNKYDIQLNNFHVNLKNKFKESYNDLNYKDMMQVNKGINMYSYDSKILDNIDTVNSFNKSNLKIIPTNCTCDLLSPTICAFDSIRHNPLKTPLRMKIHKDLFNNKELQFSNFDFENNNNDCGYNKSIFIPIVSNDTNYNM